MRLDTVTRFIFTLLKMHTRLHAPNLHNSCMIRAGKLRIIKHLTHLSLLILYIFCLFQKYLCHCVKMHLFLFLHFMFISKVTACVTVILSQDASFFTFTALYFKINRVTVTLCQDASFLIFPFYYRLPYHVITSSLLNTL